VDFNIEPLMLHKLSTQGPKLAVADVNGDDLDDFYLCGAKSQPGQLALATSKDWKLSKQAAFESDANCEDVDAAFFDAESDGDIDLFVISGGGEYRDGIKQLEHRLYLNDGRGGFTKSTQVWPATNGACAVPGDFNGDGTTDLFIGSRSVVLSYGRSPHSFIFLNDGKGNFRDATTEICPQIDTMGMVTDAVWLPAERRLVVVGEWMPLTVISMSDNTRSSIYQLPDSEGWWNTLSAADMDSDGDLDLLAGNVGLNINLAASSDEPVELFVKDFDGNGATEPVLTHYRQGKRYCFASKDELVGQMPDLKKQFLNYAKYANSIFEQVFDQKMLHGAIKRRAVTFASTYFENLGSGRFKPVPLSVEAQISPIHAFLPGDFDGDGIKDALAVGNFYANQPAVGKLDASNGWFLTGNGKGQFSVHAADRNGFRVPGEGRDIQPIKQANNKFRVLVARNNDSVLEFEW
jgi:hypothetical protein